MRAPTARERIGGGYGCSTGKRMFTTHKIARRYIKRNGDRWPGGRRRTYRCTECGMVHITKIDHHATKKIREDR